MLARTDQGVSISRATAIHIGLAILFFLLLVRIIIWPHPLGLADNHDYWRLMNPMGFVYLAQDQDNFYSYLNLLFLKTGQWHGTLISSGLLFVFLAYSFTQMLETSFFPLLLLGTIHSFFYSVVYYFFIKNSFIKKWLALVVFFAITTITLSDTLFTAYFNSFYQESAGFICFLGFVAVFQARRGHFWFELLLVSLLALTKVANLLFVLLFLPLLWKYKGMEHFKSRVIVMVCFCIAILFQQIINQNIRESPNIFNSFFKGLVTESNYTQVLVDFSLADTRYVAFVGKDFWAAEIEKSPLKEEFFSKVNHTKILVYYLTHPRLLLNNSAHAFRLLQSSARPDNLGNRTKEFSEQLVIDFSIAAIWQRVFPYALWPGFLLSIIQGVYLLKRKKIKLDTILLIILPLLLPLQIALTFLGDGWHEFAKHNVTFYFTFTLWFLLSLQFWYKQLEHRKI